MLNSIPLGILRMSSGMQEDLGAFGESPFGQVMPMSFSTPEGTFYGKRALEMARDLNQRQAERQAKRQASTDTVDEMLEHDEAMATHRDPDAPEEYADPYAGGYKASLKAFDERCGRIVPPEEGATSFNQYGSNAPESEEENEWSPWDSKEDYEKEMLANCIMSERM